jgi:predicted outer membrane protein
MTSRSVNSNVLDAARLSASAHERLYKKLRALGKAFEFEFPPKASMEDCPEFRKAQTLTGAELDKAYLDYLRGTNTTAIQEFHAELAQPEKPNNYSLRKLAEKYLPTLEQLQAKLDASPAAPPKSQ